MQFFINEVSLQGQYTSQEHFVEAIQIFLSILNSIKEIKTYYLYKDSPTFMNYKAIKNQNFQRSLNNLRDKSLIRAFNNILYNKINPKEWRDEQLHKDVDNFDYIDIDNNYVDVKNTSLAEVAERKLQATKQIYLVINFIDSIFKKPHPELSNCQQIRIIKNNDEVNFICIDCVENKSGLESWKITLSFKDIPYNYNSKNPPRDEQTILSDNARFIKTSYICHGRKIYQEEQTRNYWYVDNFHFGKTAHIEVFDTQGNHLGEADLEGNIDINKQDQNKHLDI